MKMRVFSNNFIFSFDGDKKTIKALKLILSYHQKKYIPLIIELLKIYNPSALKELNIKGNTYFYKESILKELLKYLGEALNFNVSDNIKNQNLIPFLLRHILKTKEVSNLEIPILAVNHVKIGLFKWASIYYIDKIKGLFVMIDRKPRTLIIPPLRSMRDSILEIYISKLFLANLDSPAADIKELNFNINPHLFNYIKLFYGTEPKINRYIEKDGKVMFCFSFKGKKYVVFFPASLKEEVFYDKSKKIVFSINHKLSVVDDLGVIVLHNYLKGQLKGENTKKIKESGYYIFRVDKDYNNYFQNFSFSKDKVYVAYITKSGNRYIIRNPETELWEVIFVDNKDIFLFPFESYEKYNNYISKMNVIKSQMKSTDIKGEVKNFLKKIL